MDPYSGEDRAEKRASKDELDKTSSNDEAIITSDVGIKYASTSSTNRKLESYHINLISLGGTIGTALFIYMGEGLTNGGPGNLLMGYGYWVSVVWAIAITQRELVVRWPTDSGFTRYAGRYVDPAAGFVSGWNWFLLQAALVIFECVAFGIVLGFWENARINAAITISIVIGSYAVLNLWSTRFYGNSEFVFAMGKILLIVGLLLFTFVTMLGGNPQHDRFGFRYWNNPGALTTPYPDHKPLTGRFEGFLACVINASFTVAGPDYLSMIAGEARNPRKTMDRAFKSTIYRLLVFFMGSTIAIGILVPYNDPNLLGAIASGAPGGARSPYVIAMVRMMIPVLPNIVNALILTSVFSAGNSFLFCSSRTLAQMSRDGHAPKFLGIRNRNGVPWIAVAVPLILALLSYCQVSSSAQVVITWVTSLVTAGQLVNWILMSFSYIRWRAGLKAQGIVLNHSRIGLPAAYYALVSAIFVTLLQGYGVFLKGAWNVNYFIYSYAMPILAVILFVGWKVIKRTKYQRAETMDVTSYVDSPEFLEETYEEHEANLSKLDKLLRLIF